VRAGPVHQVLQDHPATHAPADQVHHRQAERGDGGGQIIGVVAQPAGGVDRLRVGVAETAQVDRQRPVRPGQGQHDRLPEQRRRHVTVHEQHRRAIAPGHREHRDRQPSRRHPLSGHTWQQRLHLPSPPA